MKNEAHQALSQEIEDFFDLERIDCPDFCNDSIIVICCDDLCANSDYCIHGDGYAICPTCKGEGEVRGRERIISLDKYCERQQAHEQEA